jgi:hypothetical protein
MNPKGRGAILVLLVALAATPALARRPEFGEYRAVMESLSGVHPRFREYWLKSRGYDVKDFTPSYSPSSDSLGLRLVGKYGRGPSVDVTGRDTLVALSLGSEVALINFAQPSQPQVLSEIQTDFMPAKSVLADSLLVAGGKGMDIWNVADPSRPTRISRFPIGAGDFCVEDSLVCFVQTDSFRVYSIADPANPRLLGYYPDSGYVLAVSGNTVVVGQPSLGLYFVDISNPSQPKRVGIFASDYPLSADARGNLCCASFQSNADPYPIRFVTLDISDPSSVRQLARIDSAGGYGVSIWDTLAFASGRDRAYAEEFQVIDIADSAHPRILGRGTTPYDNWGVWACPPRHLAYVADRGKGLSVFDITDLTHPIRDTGIMVADLAYDVAVDGNRAYVADYVGGLRVLDVGDPTKPTELGGTDTLEAAVVTAVAKDSFAYANWWPSPYFRTFDVSDPTHPRKVAGGSVQTEPADMVLRDTLVFLAGRLRFNVVNVARPREPVLVGSCVLSGETGDMELVDTIAFLSGLPLTIVNVTRPDSPQIVGTWAQGVWGMDVVDTMLYAVGQNAQFWTLSVANPANPRLLGSLTLPSYDGQDVVVVGTTAFIGERAIRVVDVSDPAAPQLCGAVSVPGWADRLLYDSPYVYAACYDAGVCIFETTQTGVFEEALIRGQTRLAALPSVTAGVVSVVIPAGGLAVGLGVFDVSGKEVMQLAPGPRQSGASSVLSVNLAGLPAGVYVFRGIVGGQATTAKVVKTQRR